MLVDFFMFLLPFTPNDFLFVGHHLMTIGYMFSSLHINRGGLSCLILMVLGESTSLFQNSWLMSRELRRDNKVRASPPCPCPLLLDKSKALCHFSGSCQQTTAMQGVSCAYTSEFQYCCQVSNAAWQRPLPHTTQLSCCTTDLGHQHHRQATSSCSWRPHPFAMNVEWPAGCNGCL